MTIVRPFLRAACVALALVAAACGGSSTPTTPTPTPTPTPVTTTTVVYSGLFASGLFTGTVTLTALVPVSGTANVPPNAPLATATASGTAKFSGASTTTINLTGTYDTTTGRFTLTSPGWTVDATVVDGKATGTISTPAGAGSLSALATTEANPVVNYCGSYSGTESGKFLVVVRGGLASGVAAENGLPGGITLAGSVNGNAITLSWSWIDDGAGTGRATGTINGNAISGTWDNSDGQSGTWTGASGC